MTSTSLPLPASERMQRALLAQLRIVTGAAWALALYAGMQAPWVNDILAFIAHGKTRALNEPRRYLSRWPLILRHAPRRSLSGDEASPARPSRAIPGSPVALAGGCFPSYVRRLCSYRTAQTLRLAGRNRTMRTATSDDDTMQIGTISAPSRVGNHRGAFWPLSGSQAARLGARSLTAEPAHGELREVPASTRTRHQPLSQEEPPPSRDQRALPPSKAPKALAEGIKCRP